MFWQIRKRDDGALMETYEGDVPVIKGGELGDDARFVQLPVPEGYDPSVVDYNAGTEETGPYLEVNADKLVAWKKSENLRLKSKYALEREASADVQIAALLEGNAEATVLMIAANNLFKYLVALQVAAGIEDTALSTDGQESKAALVAMQTALYDQVQAYRAARDADIAAFVAPHQDVSPLYP